MLSDLEKSLIAAAISSKIDEAAKKKYGTPTQEHQLTSRIAGLLEDLNGLEVFQNRITVVAQELPDKGAGALEKPTGADMYISITDSGFDGFSKGILVQTKRLKPTLKPVAEGFYYRSMEDPRLADQCARMLHITPESYVWVYGEKGVGVVHARDALDTGEAALEPVSDRSTYDLFRKIVECEEGDPRYGLPHGGDKRAQLIQMLDTFRREARVEIKQGVDIRISPASDRRVGRKRRA
jgi:hypothetical protein